MSIRPTDLSVSTPARNERAFGVVEVVIAVLLIMVVASGLVLAMSSSERLRGSARLQASMTSTGQRMIEDLTSHRDWMKTCDAPRSACRLDAEFTTVDELRLEDVDGTVQVLPESSATAVDSQVDGIGQTDQDGVLVDHYDIVLLIRPSADVVSRYPGTPVSLTRRFATTIDRNGRILEGSLRVEGCVVRNQVDERMSINACAASGISNVMMAGCPPTPPANQAWFYTGCTSAWNWVRDIPSSGGITQPSPFVKMQRVDLGDFHIVNSATGDSVDSSSADVVNGGYVFKDLKAGTYRIVGLPGAVTVSGISHPRWRTKEQPSWHDDPLNVDGSVGVQPGIKSDALVMFRVPRTNRGIRFNLDRQVDVRRLDRGVYRVERTDGPYAIEGLKYMPTDTYDGSEAMAYCQQHLSYGDDSSSWYSDPDGNPSDWEDTGDGNGSGREYFKLLRDTGYNKMYHSCYISDHEDPHCKTLRYYKFWKKYTYTDPEDDGPISERDVEITDWYNRSGEIRYCTYYRNELEHEYYQAGNPFQQIRPGAYRSAVYEVSPRPTPREVTFTGPHQMSLSGATTTRNYCIVRGHTSLPAGTAYSPARETASRDCIAGSSMDRLHPGLNSSVTTPDDATITNATISDSRTPGHGASTTNSVQAHLNKNIIDVPDWAARNGIWVRPDGGITGGDGLNKGVNPTINLRGKGECYWTGGPTGTTAQYEGSCDPCSPYWVPQHIRINACVALTKTCVQRFVVEVETEMSMRYTRMDGNNSERGQGEDTVVDRKGPINVPAAGGGRCVEYSPAWGCASYPPTILDDNCAAIPTGGGGGGGGDTPRLQATDTRMTGGNAHVGGQAVTTGRNGR